MSARQRSQASSASRISSGGRPGSRSSGSSRQRQVLSKICHSSGTIQTSMVRLSSRVSARPSGPGPSTSSGSTTTAGRRCSTRNESGCRCMARRPPVCRPRPWPAAGRSRCAARAWYRGRRGPPGSSGRPRSKPRRVVAHWPHLGLEQDRVERRLEVVVGDELQDAPSALGHLGALRLGSAMPPR